MSSSHPVQFDCEIDSIEEPIRGRLDDGEGRSVAFRGWIQFAAAITDFVQGAHQSSTAGQGEGNHHEDS